MVSTARTAGVAPAVGGEELGVLLQKVEDASVDDASRMGARSEGLPRVHLTQGESGQYPSGQNYSCGVSGKSR